MTSKKKCQPSTVWHNSLVKSRSNLRQESWEKIKLRLYSSTSSNMEGCAADRCAHIRAHNKYLHEESFFSTWDKWQPKVGNYWRSFFLFFFCKKITMATWVGEQLELLLPASLLGLLDKDNALQKYWWMEPKIVFIELLYYHMIFFFLHTALVSW
jgi:hypothetical protein